MSNEFPSGTDAFTIIALQDVGSCGFGYISRSSFPYTYIAAPVRSSSLDLWSGQCGTCVEIKCTGTPLWDASYPCYDSKRTIVAQVGLPFYIDRSSIERRQNYLHRVDPASWEIETVSPAHGRCYWLL